MKATVPFRQLFDDWLETCLSERITKNVRALSFSISQRELCFRVELNGTSEFDCHGTNWTWSECWSPLSKKLCVPTNVCCGVSDNCHHAIMTEILRYIRHGDLRQKLQRFEGIAVESMDGDYELVWLNQSVPQRKLPRSRILKHY